MAKSRFKFKIRSLLAMTATAAILLGFAMHWVRRAENQKAQLDALREERAAVGYKLPKNGIQQTIGDKIGVDMVAQPKELFLNSRPDEPVDMASIIAVDTIEHLVFNMTGVTDDDLGELHKMKNLKYLNVSSTKVSDAGISNITDLNLISLHIEHLNLTDACIDSLSKIKSLKWISATKGTFSQEAVKDLKSQLPECEIHLAN